MDWALAGSYLFVFLARVFDVTCSTMRVLLLVRGKRWIASSIGFFEVIIYVLALGQVVGRLHDPLSLVIYGMGFATGNLVGSFLEEKVAVGFLMVQIIPTRNCRQLIEDLRREGFGVTVFCGQGRHGAHDMLTTIISRKKLDKLQALVNRWDEHAFISILDTRSTRGGFFPPPERLHLSGMPFRQRLGK